MLKSIFISALVLAIPVTCGDTTEPSAVQYSLGMDYYCKHDNDYYIPDGVCATLGGNYYMQINGITDTCRGE